MRHFPPLHVNQQVRQEVDEEQEAWWGWTSLPCVSVYTLLLFSEERPHTDWQPAAAAESRQRGEKTQGGGGVFCSLLPPTQTLRSSLDIFWGCCFCVCLENTPSLLNFILVICRHSGARTALLGNCCHGEQKHTHSCCSRSHGKSCAFYCFRRRWGTFRREVRLWFDDMCVTVKNLCAPVPWFQWCNLASVHSYTKVCVFLNNRHILKVAFTP